MILWQTERLIVRHHTHDDYETWEAGNDPDRFLERAGSREAAKALRRGWFVNQFACQERYDPAIAWWAVALRDRDIYVGSVGGDPGEIEGRKIVDIGWYLLPDWHGRGLGTEAARAMLALTESRGLPTRVATIRPDNLRSRRVAEKIGMAYQRNVESDIGMVALYALPGTW